MDPRSDTRSARRRRPLAAILAALALATLTAYLGVCAYAAAEFTRPIRLPVDGPPQIRVQYEDISLRTVDGLTLRGWFFPGATDRAVVVVHGRNANRREWQGRSEHIAQFLLASGYSVVLFDLRGHGESEGTRFSLGYYERYDVASALAFLEDRGFRKERIGILAISLGGASALAELTLDAGIGPVVLDSSYADIGTIISEVLAKEHGLPGVFTPGILAVARAQYGIDPGQVNPVDVVRAHPERAFLFIHCDTDDLIPVHHARDLRAASAHPASDLWIAPNCLHPRASDDHPDEYRQRVLAFLAAQMR